MKKLGLSVYRDDPTPEEMRKYAIIQDESVWVNKEKLLLTLGIPADFLNRPVGHADARILDMRVGKSFSGDEVKQPAEDAAAKAGTAPDYAVTDQGRNLVNGLANTEISHYIDVSHAIGTCSDIIESNFGIFKAKKSPNKLYGVTSLVLMMPLYPKVVNQSVTKNIDFKERLANVKLADVDAWAKEHLSENTVVKRSKNSQKTA